MSSEYKDYAEFGKAFLRELLGRQSNVVLTGTYAMQADGEPLVQMLDANGAARNVKLPAEAGSRGKFLLIFNPAAGAFSLTLQDSQGNALSPAVTVAQNKAVLAYCNGTAWRALIGA